MGTGYVIENHVIRPHPLINLSAISCKNLGMGYHRKYMVKKGSRRSSKKSKGRKGPHVNALNSSKSFSAKSVSKRTSSRRATPKGTSSRGTTSSRAGLRGTNARRAASANAKRKRTAIRIIPPVNIAPSSVSETFDKKRTGKSAKGSWFRVFLLMTAACVVLCVIAFGNVWSKLSRGADQDIERWFSQRVPPTLTKILDNKGNVIGILANQKRTLIPYGDIPKAFQGAIVAAEDADFWNHRGVSSRGFFGAIYRGARSLGKERSGFSTLTMQLVRTVTEKRERNILKGAFSRKIREIIVAIRLEKLLKSESETQIKPDKLYHKKKIMEHYANEVNFGAGHYGIEAASQYYFRKSALELSIEESALLAALVQMPTKSHDRLFSTDPKEREIVRNRRNYVISRMASERYLGEGDAALLKERPIRLGRENAGDEDIAAYAVEEVRKILEPKYGKERLMEGGFEIHTTIDSLWQQAATDAVQRGLRAVERRRGFRKETVRFYENPETAQDSSWQRFYEPGDTARGIIMGWRDDIARVRLDRSIVEVPFSAFAWAGRPALTVLTRGAAPLFTIKETNPDGTPKSLELDQIPEVEGALLAVDSRTGEIRAMVGGYNFRRSQFNRATQAFRQVGSSMKAFVYGAALLKGYTPATIVDDCPTNFQFGMTSYEPKNYENNFLGPMTLWEALAHSRNIPAVKTLEMAGISAAVDFATNCGITSYIPPYPSMALGATDLTLKELVRAYATISSGGYQCPEPFLIKKVVDRSGRVLEERKPLQTEFTPIIDPVVNFQLIQMLQGVTSSGTAGGTTAALNWPVAGKTGTTNDHTDAWFMGFSTRVTCGVWVGLDAKKNIDSDASGAKTALPIWTNFMKVVLPTTPKEDFKPPEGLEWIDLDVDTGLRAGPATESRRMRSLAFRPGTGPRNESDFEAIARFREAKARVKYAETIEHIWGTPPTAVPPLEHPPKTIDPNDY